MPGRVSAPTPLLRYSLSASRAALREIEKKLASLPEEAAQEPRDGEDHITMGNGREHFLLQPLGPQELFFLLLLRKGYRDPSACGEQRRCSPGGLGGVRARLLSGPWGKWQATA